MALGEPTAGAIPLSYAAISLATLAVFAVGRAGGATRTHPYRLYKISQLLLIPALLAIERHNVSSPHQLQARIGVNSGPAVAGVIGQSKFQYDIWGDAVNLASRMESHGVPGRVQIAPGTHDLVVGQFALESLGEIDIKGRGETPAWLVIGALPVTPVAADSGQSSSA